MALTPSEANTALDICSRALILIGAEPISSFDDGSTEAYSFRASELDFPSYFTLAVQFSLSVILATSIARDASLAQLMTIRADGAMAKARSLDSQQQTTRRLETNRFITARQS
jgi:hypothetical protein